MILSLKAQERQDRVCLSTQRKARRDIIKGLRNMAGGVNVQYEAATNFFLVISKTDPKKKARIHLSFLERNSHSFQEEPRIYMEAAGRRNAYDPQKEADYLALEEDLIRLFTGRSIGNRAGQLWQK